MNPPGLEAQERCAQLSCASKPGGFMQPSGALGAHDLLVRPGDAWRKRKKEENAATGILRILSGLTCGFLSRRSAWKIVSISAAKPPLWPPPRNTQKRPVC